MAVYQLSFVSGFTTRSSLSNLPPGSTNAPSSPLCTLLTLSRQIYAEANSFLRSQLLVLLKTNDKAFIQKTLDEDWGQSRVSLVSQLRSRDGTITKNASSAPVAMELDFYMYHNDQDTESYAAFLIPASSVKTMAQVQASPAFYIWTMQALLSVKLFTTFSYEKEEAQKRLFQPFFDILLRPVYVGVQTEGVDTAWTDKLRDTLKGKYSAGGHMQKLQSLMHNATPRSSDEDWDGPAGRFSMAASYARMLWDCHQECLRDPSLPFDGIHHLWMMHSNICGNQVQILLNKATGGPMPNVPTGKLGESNEAFGHARAMAEEGIRFLGPLPEWGRPETAQAQQAMTALRKSKAKVSFRAHSACKGMGDLDAAVGYLREAMKFEPETSVILMERMDKLKGEGVREEDVIERVVKWE
ncbi:hypothetical protein N0V90_002643 [Kalmusia sp. IMI 367209]|nr:hypothetical protein N0V90_002643 [Kalmusia sp. IMI 367209]